MLDPLKLFLRMVAKTSGFTGAVIAAPAGTEFAKYHQNSLLGVGSLLTT